MDTPETPAAAAATEPQAVELAAVSDAAVEIVPLCTLAGKPERATEFIRERATVEAVRTALMGEVQAAQAAEPVITPASGPATPSASRPRADLNKTHDTVYARMKARRGLV